ncbi:MULTISPECIES: AMP-binding protein [unclassified Pseudonocardia]|uniref:AMP-binding protein n=1 Tax=unclassified Pseudonocardia TaxID=2619320 RepID=UPI000AC13483|nr:MULTISPECIES: AMP-binding protein [unclassified Pseudonocardia]
MAEDPRDDAAPVVPHPVAAHRAPSGPPLADLPSLLGDLARRDPAVTVALDHTQTRGTVVVTRGQLWARTCRLTAELTAHGVGPGDCVAIWLPTWSDVLAWQFAVAARGAHVVGINTRYNVDEVAHVLERARPALVVVAHDFHGLDLLGRLRAALADPAAADVATPVVALVAGPGEQTPDPGPADVGAGSWTPSADGTAPDPAPSDPGALAVAFTTSGSTGMPKLAAHSGRAVLDHAAADAAAIGLRDTDVMLCALPLSGVYGFNATTATLAAGGVCLFVPVFDADVVVDLMAAHRVTHVAAGDDMVLRLRAAHDARPRDLSAWRWWGAADFQGRLRELAEWAADLGVVTSGVYGASELFALLSMWPDAEPAPDRWRAGGRVAHPGIEVRVADPETGEPVADGTEGELQFRGSCVVDAYLGDPDRAAAVRRADGWFGSGDLGVLVDEGAFVYVCRMGDALRLRGFLVDPAEIEVRLAAHAGVDTAKVVGITADDGATIAIGFVTAAPGEAPDPAELREWCAQGLARFKIPETVHVVREMPTTSGTNGAKIRAAVLREWALQRRG